MAKQGVIVWQAAGMSVRPYPSRDRTLRQILRRHRNQTPPGATPIPRPAEEPGQYVLSSRRDPA